MLSLSSFPGLPLGVCRKVLYELRICNCIVAGLGKKKMEQVSANKNVCKKGKLCYNFLTTIHDFIKKRKHLIWYVKDYDKLSPESIVEATLNYGN